MNESSEALLEAIIEILDSGQLDLTELYQRVRERSDLDLSRFSTEAGLDARIRKLIYLHASECELYEGTQDLFYSETGKGTGRWGLRR
jgi:putative restriction endonuclease